jgi:phosphoadenosine phosphosulfate reductase
MSDILRALADELNEAFAGADLPQRLHLLRDKISGRIVFTTSLGIEDQALTHAIAVEKLDITFATLDTGRLFPETYAVALVGRQGINGFYDSLEARKACCNVRKVEPLSRALTSAQAWVAGLRGDQSDHRSHLRYVEFDDARGLIKASPLLDFSRDDVAQYCAANDVPINELHAKNFVSIGCAPCTRAIAPGEPERAGRWWWEDEAKKECGLHIGADGKIVRASEAVAS